MLVLHFRVTETLCPRGWGSGYHGNRLAYRQERENGWGFGCDLTEVEGILFIIEQLQNPTDMQHNCLCVHTCMNIHSTMGGTTNTPGGTRKHG